MYRYVQHCHKKAYPNNNFRSQLKIFDKQLQNVEYDIYQIIPGNLEEVKYEEEEEVKETKHPTEKEVVGRTQEDTLRKSGNLEIDDEVQPSADAVHSPDDIADKQQSSI